MVTIFGDAIVPRGDVMRPGALQQITDHIGISNNALRTAMSRLASDGWLSASVSEVQVFTIRLQWPPRKMRRPGQNCVLPISRFRVESSQLHLIAELKVSGN
ncbi:MAG: hypothetical protein GY761_06780 [Hyphomicrobiales bacterium]|nr:hypothetical protein [Hyphomicrobiales bacterium]